MDVTLRAAVESDLAVLFENQRDPEGVAMAAFPARELDAFLAHRAKIAANPENIIRTIVVSEDGVEKVAGDIGSWPTDDGVRELGYWVGREFWGRGVATAALRAMLAEVTERPIYAHVVKHNVGSQRVLEKCGFKPVPPGELPGEHDPAELDLVLT